MLIIKLNCITKEVYWHIGEPCPIHYDSMDIVEEVQMDGDELNWVMRLFTSGEPYTKRPDWIPRGLVARLFGDEAKKIVANLNNIK